VEGWPTDKMAYDGIWVMDILLLEKIARSYNTDLLSFRLKGEIHVPSNARDLLDFSSLWLLEMTNLYVSWQYFRRGRI
jgi:hypothetical protein